MCGGGLLLDTVLFVVYGNCACKMTTPAAAKWARYDTDYQRCIICQTEKDQELMVTPSAHENILKYIRERARYGDGNFPDLEGNHLKVVEGLSSG